MSEQPNSQHIPDWRLCDRLRRSLDEAGMGVQEMADYLGKSRGTIGNWINGHNTPDSPALKLWAMRTGVPYEWLTGRTACYGKRPRRPHLLAA